MKVVGLTPGGLCHVSETGLRGSQETLIAAQESAAGTVDGWEPVEGPNGWRGE